MTTTDRKDLFTFWGCFIALITTSTAFITRAFLVNDPNLWPAEFALDKVQAQALFGAGIWPFAISIILFSLVIDRIGYRAAMFFSFICYALYGVLALKARAIVHPAAGPLTGHELIAARESALQCLTWGSIILGLGNGTVEAFVNPVTATLFKKEKTKWLNILHAGWPGGLVLGGIITIALGAKVQQDWRILVWLLAVPVVVYVLMLAKAKFPVNERVAAGAGYREMLAEFGTLGAAIAAFFITRELGGVFEWPPSVVWGLFAALVAAYGLYCRSLGRPMLVFLCLVMLPLAITELGTDGAITGILEEPLKSAGHNPLWVLIYTSAIMFVLRFFAGPIIHRLSPLGLLAVCSALAITGLFALSKAQGLFLIFAAATLYGVGKTFFWPTILGVVAEQYPKGGALTLNAISGIGMLTAGIIGGPLIGAMQENCAHRALDREIPGVHATISRSDTYFLGAYTAIDEEKLKALPPAPQEEVRTVVKQAKQEALAQVTVFPVIMLVCFIGLILWFRSRGGYKPVDLHGAERAQEAEPGM